MSITTQAAQQEHGAYIASGARSNPGLLGEQCTTTRIATSCEATRALLSERCLPATDVCGK
jgi:hypothetical protein